MRVRSWLVVWGALTVGAASCGEGTGSTTGASAAVRLTSALTAAPPAVRVSEIHYDNVGTDADEAIEISAPAGTDVSGWTVVLYNGLAGGGVAYNTQTLSGSIPATCGDRGVLVIGYPVNGIQNGGATIAGTADPDGVALVDASGAVVEFLSYEGSIAATTGPAAGLTSGDIGVRELGSELAGQSVQRDGAGIWSGPSPNSFGACNDNAVPPPPAEIASVVVAPATAAIVEGGTQAFTALALDAANQPVAGTNFTWTSSAPAFAGVSAGGVATGVTSGSAVIIATAPNGVAGTASLQVNAAPPPPPPPPGLPDVRFSEIHYDNTGADVNEAIEIEGPAGVDLTGWSVVLYDGNGGVTYNTTALGGTIAAVCDARGVVVVPYPQNGLQNGSPDGFALIDSAGSVVEFLSYEGTFTATNGPAMGTASIDIGASEATSSSPGASLQRDEFNRWDLGSATLGGCNGGGAPPPPPPGNTISFSGRLAGDPALPVGFQDQLFATVRDANNVVVTTAITWSSETPAVATIDGNGVMTALGEGTATFRATADDGVTTATHTLPMRVGVRSTTALYAGNVEFGEPTDADPSDDFIVRHPEYTASYNPNRGTPNWVSYDLEATHFGPEDRCDCFTFDPELPATFARYTTADYTGAAVIAGYGIDRGHMTRSFDRTSASLDNAATFYFSNVVPQASDLNQGPWAMLENELGDRARFGDREVYIVTGVAGNKGTLKNEGKVVIPARTWKVAVIMPHDRGLADVVDYRDLEIIAVDMPNDPGVRNVPWQTYLTTVDAIEQVTGYDLLALLPDRVEAAVEAGIKPPLAALDGPYSATEGGPAIAMSAAASVDPNGTVVGYAWDFGDGATATGPIVSHAYAQDGVYTVRVVVTDNDGLTGTAATSVSVADVEPPPPPPPPSTQALLEAAALVAGLVDDGKLGASWGRLLSRELALAWVELGRGRPVLVVGTLRVVLVELDLLARFGILRAPDALPLRTLVTGVIQSMST